MSGGRNYQCKGDRFTQLVDNNLGPPTVKRIQHPVTGRVYYRRVPTSGCSQVQIKDVLPLLTASLLANLRKRNAEHQSVAEAWTELALIRSLRWWPQSGMKELTSVRIVEDGSFLLGLAIAGGGQGRGGFRLRLECPGCQRACQVLYGSLWDRRGQRLSVPIVGCRSCLGLTDQSRQQHKTLEWCGAVLGERPYGHDGHYRARSGRAKTRAYLQAIKLPRGLAEDWMEKLV
jgi:hypothetical protein